MDETTMMIATAFSIGDFLDHFSEDGTEFVDRIYEDDSLEHYGRKGQSWREHKYGEWQKHARYAMGREDPNKKPEPEKTSESAPKLTKEEQKARLKETKAKAKQARVVQKRKEQQANERRKETKRETKEARKEAKLEVKRAKIESKLEKERQEIIRNPTKLREHQYEFSRDEVEEALKRFDQDRRLADISAGKVKRGSDYVSNLANMAGSMTKLYNLTAVAYNSFTGSKLPLIKAEEKKKDDKKKKDDS